MQRHFSTLLCLVSLGLFSGNASVAADATRTPEWNKRMKAFSDAISELLPDVISQDRYNSPKNFQRIEKNVKVIADLAHNMPSKNASPLEAGSADSDVSIPMISDLFKNEAKRAYQELKRGRRAYARTVLRALPNFCIACHTRSSGADLSTLKNDPPATLVSRLERAEYFAATRQFDRALSEYEEVVADKNAASKRQIEWERAFRHSLSIAVRVKRDPARALGLVDRALASPTCPSFLKEDATQWQKSLVEWKAEPHRTSNTPDGILAEARSLLTKAHALQRFPADHSADMVYLRVSSAVHDLLRASPTNGHLAEGLFLLGVSYEALQDMELWSLHELYYESCIRKFPGTATARGCFRRYEESVYSGYTGSGGVSLPADVSQELTDLRKLSGTGTEEKKD